MATVSDSSVLLKHERLGFAELLNGFALSAFDGQTGSPDILVSNDDGSYWGLGGSEWATRYYPFSSRPPTRLGSTPFPAGTRYIVSSSREWMIASSAVEVGFHVGVARRTRLVSLQSGATVRELSGWSTVPYSERGVGPWIMMGGSPAGMFALEVSDGRTTVSPDAGVSPDASTPMCGDGRYDIPEECEPGVSGAPRCQDGYCSNCRCVANVCGDGQRTGSEGCEFNRDCSAGAVCRRCQCAFADAAVTYSDTMGDVPSTPQGYAIDYIQFAVDGSGEDRITFGYQRIGGVQPDMLSQVCLVIQVAQGQQQRLCLQGMRLMPLEVTFTGVDGQTRVLAPGDVSLGSGPDSIAVQYPASLFGLRIEAGVTFTVESRYGGALTDVLPDVGAASFDEVVGR